MMSNNFSANILRTILTGTLNISVPAIIFVSDVLSQAKRNPTDNGLVPQAPQPVPEDFTMWYLGTFLLVITLGIVLTVWYRRKPVNAGGAQSKNSGSKKEVWDSDALDGDKEMEWLRKHNNIINKKRPKKPSGQSGKDAAARQAKAKPAPVVTSKEIQLAGVSDLPFNSILRLEYPHTTDSLPVSEDVSLLEAIEQTLDEYIDDDEMKEISMRIIAAHKTRNSIEALSQVALYDLSSTVRCRAIEILGEFDHHTVFEAVILACADPTREVRAAAARGLTRLGFNRADAWARSALMEDQGRKRQLARAAIEGGLVDRYFDRLTHSDYKQAYEAFALFTLLLKARETELIANALESHPSQLVRIALIHLIKVNKEMDALPYLNKLAEKKDLPKEVWDAVEAAIAKFTPETEEV